MTIDYQESHPDTSIRRLIRWLSHYALKRPAALALVILTILLKAAVEVLKPWPMFVLVDHILGGKAMPTFLQNLTQRLPGTSTTDGLLAWVIASTVILFILSWALNLASSFANMFFGQRMVYDLAADVLSHLQRLSLGFHYRRSVGDSIRRVTKDCDCVSAIIKDALLPILSSFVSLCAMFAIMWRIDWSLTVIALLVVPMMLVALKFYARPMLERSYRQQEVESGIYETIEQTLSAIPIVQVFNREADADRRFRETTDRAIAAALSTTSVQMQFKVLIGAATALGTAGILWLGAWRALQGSITVGEILIFLSYLASLYAPLEALMYAPSSIQYAAGSARRVLELLETGRDVVESPSAVPLARRARGEVSFEKVVFGYERSENGECEGNTNGNGDRRAVLRGLSLSVCAGQTLAIVGASGAGKSTLASLVPRLFDPWSGRVLLDGRDVRELTLASLRAQVSLVLQEPFLFPFTVAENIAYGRPDATAREVHAAAESAGADEFIRRLPEGYQTVIGERGATFSGGERQRLSIARALLRDAPVLIFDEPTSALDAATEQSVLAALRVLMRGRTTLMIAHRLSTVRGADQIVVLDAGLIAEQGPHEQLVRQNGPYARLYQTLQSRDSRPAGQTGSL